MKLLFENWHNYLKENTQRVVTFDFDDTLALSHWGEEEDDWVHDGPHTPFIEKLKKHKAEGDTVYIVTSRHEEFETKALKTPGQYAVSEFVEEYGLPVDGIYFTNGKPKIKTLLMLGSVMHHDDDPEDIKDSLDNGLEAVVSDPYGDYERLKTAHEPLKDTIS